MSPAPAESVSDQPEPSYGLMDAWRAIRARAPVDDDFKLPYRAADEVAPGEDQLSRLVEIANGYLEREHQRFDGFSTRGSQLAGFAGVLLGLLGSFLPDAFTDLGDPWCAVAKGLFLAAAVLILVTVLLCLFLVVRPLSLSSHKPGEELGERFTPAYLREEPWKLDLRHVRGINRQLVSFEWANRRKAGALFLASVSLGLGLLAVAACLGILLLDG